MQSLSPRRTYRARAGRIAQSSWAHAAMMIAVCLLGTCLATSCSKDSATNPDGNDHEETPALLTAVTDASGLASIVDGSDAPVVDLELRDPEGAPLPGIEVVYLASPENALIGFTAPESGDPAGTFLLAPSKSPCARDAGDRKGDPTTDFATFVLDLLDPTQSRLYDSELDDFTPTRSPTIAAAGPVMDINAVLMVATLAPGLTDNGELQLRRIREMFSAEDRVHLVKRLGQDCDPDECRFMFQLARLFMFSAQQADDYRYHAFRDAASGRWFFLPLGVTAPVAIASPGNNVDLSGAPQAVTGTVGCSPAALNGPGGRLELKVNGATMPGALQYWDDGSGRGCGFSSNPIQLPQGESVIEVFAYVSEANRGLETPLDGLGGYAVANVRVIGEYDPGIPALTNPNYVQSWPCPDGEVTVEFDFADSDGDVVSYHEHMIAMIDGVSYEQADSVLVADYEELACFRETEAHCSRTSTYFGLDGGDTLYWEFWVVDEAGHASNHVEVNLVITGDCD